MKKIFPILFMTTFLFAACSSDGERGPQGPEGPQGPPGEALIGTTIEYEGIDFTEENDYSALIEFDDIEVFESDAVLVYLKDGEDGTSDGAPVEVFRQLPQTYYVEDGEVQYNFDFTFFDVRIFMEGTANFSNLDPAYTQDQVIRIVVVPANFAETTGVDVANYKAVMNALDLKESDVKKVSTLK